MVGSCGATGVKRGFVNPTSFPAHSRDVNEKPRRGCQFISSVIEDVAAASVVALTRNRPAADVVSTCTEWRDDFIGADFRAARTAQVSCLISYVTTNHSIVTNESSARPFYSSKSRSCMSPSNV